MKNRNLMIIITAIILGASGITYNVMMEKYSQENINPTEENNLTVNTEIISSGEKSGDSLRYCSEKNFRSRTSD